MSPDKNTTVPPEPSSDVARTISESSARLARVQRETATEGVRVRVRLLIALPVLIILLVSIFAGIMYNTVRLSFDRIAPEAVMDSFAERWLVLMLAFNAIAALVGWYLASTISSPIQNIIRLSRDIASGDFSKKARVARQDEVGALSQSFNVMVDSLNRYITTRNRFILESFSGGLIICDVHGTVTAVNTAAEKILGISAQDTVGKAVQNIFRGLGHEPLLALIEESLWKQQAITSRIIRLESKTDRKSLNVNTTTMHDETGKVFGLVINFRDMSELEKFYDHMKRTDRLAALGTFAAGMAHEIRNPLGSIKGITQLLAEDVKNNPEALEYSRIIIKEVNRLDALVQEVQEFSQPSTEPYRMLDLNHVVRDTVMLARNNSKANLREGVELRESYAELPKASAAPDKIRQALLNILMNAIQATPDGGTITVETYCLRDETLPIHIAVTNTGSSIPEKTQVKIFEPFYTTKDSGTGLGLSISYQIIRHHGGDIMVESGESGVTFTIKLPIENREREVVL
ncbi:MAG: HAMP domain-containing protein [Candidatus Sumerlaeaceae bacterium]|nr:HAMP domain-containing protein [Candidatus Sumerlaeaceae bacterium]